MIDLVHERTGHSAPIDAQPLAHGGSIVVDLEAGTYRVLTSAELKAHYELEPRPPLHKPHYATCPDARRWRERARRTATTPGALGDG